ncbi:MAG: MurR/RpiR family transcriptional regulator, partial [Rhodococcus sp. (in: high G+C Gram-positive bacteria)]|nr:MurR/RpiR family transcriptional regulator [Rhodococcus sp. (in: high G+C Gram-positive bacteria)]
MTLDRSAPASVDLLARIRASLSSLSPAELRIAEIIEADPSLASTLTVNDLAERASTSTATVVRTAKRLGFEGYPQLRLALAAISGSGTENTIPLGVDIVAADSAGEVMAKLAEFESEQLKGTAQLTDPAALEEVVSRIRSAR